MSSNDDLARALNNESFRAMLLAWLSSQKIDQSADKSPVDAQKAASTPVRPRTVVRAPITEKPTGYINGYRCTDGRCNRASTGPFRTLEDCRADCFTDKSPCTGEVKICEDVNLVGDRCQTYTPGSYMARNLGNIKMDRAMSISVPEGMSATLYDKDAFKGYTLAVKGEDKIRDLTMRGYAKRMSSLRVADVSTTCQRRPSPNKWEITN